MTDERIKQIMTQLGFPNSKSHYVAINQVINEVQLDMLRKPFTSLQQIFVHCGVMFEVHGEKERQRQRELEILDEQGGHQGVRLYFNMKDDGTEEFVCQE